jgi:hypothetical protein
LREDGGGAGEGAFSRAAGEEDEAYVGGGEIGVGEAAGGGCETEVGYRGAFVGVATLEDAGGFFDGGGGTAGAGFEVGVGYDPRREMVAEGSEEGHGVLLWVLIN